MFSELNHSRKLSKRYKRDLKFKSILHTKEHFFKDLEPGLKEVKCFKEIESIFSHNSCYDSEEEIQEALRVIPNINSYDIDSYIISYRIKQDNLMQNMAKKLKMNNKKLYLTPMKLCRISSLIKSVKCGSWTFALDSQMFSNDLEKNYDEHPIFWKIDDCKRVSRVIYDEENKLFNVKYHDKVENNDQKLFL